MGLLCLRWVGLLATLVVLLGLLSHDLDDLGKRWPQSGLTSLIVDDLSVRGYETIAAVDEVLLPLDEALEHMQDQLLVIVYEHTHDACHCQKDLVPLEIAHNYSLVERCINFEECEELLDVPAGGSLHHERQSIDDLVPVVVALLGCLGFTSIVGAL